MGSGQWSVGSGQWAVVSGQWSVGSGQWAVGGGQVVRGGPIDCGTGWYLRLGVGWHHGGHGGTRRNARGWVCGHSTTNDTNQTNECDGIWRGVF